MAIKRTNLGGGDVQGPALILPPAVPISPPAAAPWPSANRALLARFHLPVQTTLRYVNWIVTVASGNIEVGIVQLSGAGHTSYNRVMSSGVIACPAAGDIHSDLGATSLAAGDYAAYLWADNITFQTRWIQNAPFSSMRIAASPSGLTTGMPTSGTLNWNGVQGPVLTVEANI